MKVTRWYAIMLVGILVISAAFGCTPQKRPDTGQGNPPAPTAPAPSRPLPTDPNESSRLADKLAGQAVKVDGVNTATVVLTGSTAMVGVDLESGADANTVKSGVAGAVKRADNRVKNVLVSTDPELNKRIVRISKGLSQGRPISSFSKEVNELLERLSPAAR